MSDIAFMPSELDIILAIAAAVGVPIALMQYRTAQRWKKIEFAANHLMRLSNDPILSLCCIFLDWPTRKFSIPPEYFPFTKDKIFTHKIEFLTDAMAIVEGKEDKVKFEFPYLLYRDYFDKFLNYLDETNDFLEMGVFSIEQVQSLKYWVDKIIPLPNNQDSPFYDFIHHYDYIGIISLAEKFRDYERWKAVITL